MFFAGGAKLVQVSAAFLVTVLHHGVSQRIGLAPSGKNPLLVVHPAAAKIKVCISPNRQGFGGSPGELSVMALVLLRCVFLMVAIALGFQLVNSKMVVGVSPYALWFGF